MLVTVLRIWLNDFKCFFQNPKDILNAVIKERKAGDFTSHHILFFDKTLSIHLKWCYENMQIFSIE